MITLKEYIAALQDIYDEHGDLPLIYSSDDEGNEYHQVGLEPGVVYCDLSDYYVESVYANLVDYCEGHDEYNEDDDNVEEFNSLTKVVIVN
ncbi:MAG: hypothetical protein ACKVQA_26240 [Burkholderiales bacterium]